MTEPRISFLTSVAAEDDATIRNRLRDTVVRIVAAREATRSVSGQVLSYQLATLVARLFDRIELVGDAGDGTMPSLHLTSGPFLTSLGEILRNVRPGVSVTVNGRDGSPSAIRVLVGAGNTDVEDGFDVYVGSTDWTAMVSVARPQAILAPEDLPVGALAAGALGAAEVFKRVFGDVLRGSVVLNPGSALDGYALSLLTYGSGSGEEPTCLPQSVPVDITLIGCGSIGCAAFSGWRQRRESWAA